VDERIVAEETGKRERDCMEELNYYIVKGNGKLEVHALRERERDDGDFR